MNVEDAIIDVDDKILITGANGFIGNRVVCSLLEKGFTNLSCLVRSNKNLNNLLSNNNNSKTEIIKGNLLSKDDCKFAARDASVIIHLAAGVGKAYSTCVLNSVVTTRNLLDAALEETKLKRFVNISSFAVYDPTNLKRGALLDETCPIIQHPEKRGEAYCYGKVKQDELVMEYSRKHGISYVILRPGAVFGPGKNAITGRVGIDTFGIYFHMGGNNRIPLVYVDNCADAIVFAALKKGVDQEIFNVVDDDLPRSCDFLKQYKQHVKNFRSIDIHYQLSHMMCWIWEKYSKWSEGQLPPAFNTSRWAANWKGHRYTNEKLKRMTGWQPQIPMDEALKRYFDFSKRAGEIQ